MSTRTGVDVAREVRKGKPVGVIWGRHGQNKQVSTRDGKTSVILLDETADGLKDVPGAREHPDTVFHHELRHHNDPTLSEPRIRELENKYRKERGIGPREVYQNLSVGF
jgi:hypothetical protein